MRRRTGTTTPAASPMLECGGENCELRNACAARSGARRQSRCARARPAQRGAARGVRSARTAQTPRRRGAEPPKRGAEPTHRAELSRRAELPSGAAAHDEPPSRVEPPSRAAEPAAEPCRAESLNTCAAPPTAHSHRAHRTTWRRKAPNKAPCRAAHSRTALLLLPQVEDRRLPPRFFVNALSGRTMTTTRYFLALESVGMNQICAATDTHERHGTIMIKRRSRVLRRRTRQAALDKPRVHDGQLGFCYTKTLKSVTLENRAFEEKQHLDCNEIDSKAWYVDKRHQIASCPRERAKKISSSSGALLAKQRKRAPGRSQGPSPHPASSRDGNGAQNAAVLAFCGLREAHMRVLARAA